PQRRRPCGRNLYRLARCHLASKLARGSICVFTARSSKSRNYLILLCTLDTWIVRSQKIETGVHRIAHTEKPSPHWIKVKNRRYSQLEGREEWFDQLLIRVAA